MTTKTETHESKTEHTDHQGQERKLQDDVKDTAHRIWLAGLGALAAAEDEGSKLFSRLVDRGRDVEARGKVEVEKVVDKAKSEFGKAKAKAGTTFEDLGDKVDDTITAALHRLGVPTRDEIHNLTRRVEELNSKIESLRPRVTHAPNGAANGEEKPSPRSAKSVSKAV
jgi:poly(hydroxyalkanoate) granule-associated protein